MPVFLSHTTASAQIIISISLILFSGFAMTRITKRLRLPNVTGYILAGILLGPYCLGLVPASFVEGSDFLADIALAFIAFSTGEFFRVETLKKSGWKVIAVTVLESLTASVLVFLVTYWILGVGLGFSVVLGALAAATAPASTMLTIRQTGARGEFVDTLLQVVALDDVVGLLAYSIAISVAVAGLTGGFRLSSILKPLAVNASVFLLGGGVRRADEAAHAEGPIHRQPADHFRGHPVCVLRGVYCAGRVAPFGLYVHGDGIYQHHRR